MPVNPGIEYQKAEEEYRKASTLQEKLAVLKLMYATAPKHKGSEVLLSNIKQRIAKLNEKLRQEKKKKGYSKFSIKKEDAATICIVGTPNSGKSTLLKKLTNANVAIEPYKFTTTKPEIGVMDYYGIKIQVIEIPAIVKDFSETKNGLAFLGIIRSSDLIILMYKNKEEKKLLVKELENINVDALDYEEDENFKDKIWNKLNLIKVYTKMPGKEKEYPPVALKKYSLVRDLAEQVHKDFIEKFKFARVWGKSVKHNSNKVSLDHKLDDNDVVELHLK